jgi:hypothetical protein
MGTVSFQDRSADRLAAGVIARTAFRLEGGFATNRMVYI